MGWKKWPYWIKGGIFGLIILLLLSISAFSVAIDCFGCSDDECTRRLCPTGFFFEKVRGIVNFPLIGVVLNIPLTGSFLVLFNLVLYIAYYFAIGAIAGWIYEKIKSKKK